MTRRASSLASRAATSRWESTTESRRTAEVPSGRIATLRSASSKGSRPAAPTRSIAAAVCDGLVAIARAVSAIAADSVWD